MNDDPRNAIEPDDPINRRESRHEQNSADDSGVFADRGMPALGRYRRVRPRAWWLTPLVVILVAGAGAVWTINAFLIRHDADAKARRDAMTQTVAHGRVFADVPVTSSGAAAPVVSSAPALTMASPPASAPQRLPVHSYFDAPLLATDTMSGEGRQAESGADAGGAGSGRSRGADAASSVAGSVSTRTGAGGSNGSGTLAQVLTPAVMPGVRAGILGNRSLLLAQGAKIDCVGDTAFDSTEAGLSTCTVTRDVYSDDGRVVLIERGSQVNSQYRSNLSPGKKRVFILAARIETPRGVTVEINSPVADALGRMGVDGYVDNHWSERIGAAMLLGMTQDAVGYLASRGGNNGGTVVYENTQQQGNDMATRVLDRTIGIPPTLKQNQGAEFTIVVARDLDFGSVYALQPGDMP